MNRKNGAVMPKNLTKNAMYDIIQIYIYNADAAAQHSIAARAVAATLIIPS